MSCLFSRRATPISLVPGSIARILIFVDLLPTEWVKIWRFTLQPLSRQEVFGLQGTEKRGMTPGCKDIDDSGTHIGFLAFGPATPCGASLGIPKRGSWCCSAGEKNGLRQLWAGAPYLFRPQGAAGGGVVVRGRGRP